MLAWRFLIAFGGGSLICFRRRVRDGARARPRRRRGAVDAGLGRLDDQHRLRRPARSCRRPTGRMRCCRPPSPRCSSRSVMFPAAVILQEVGPRLAPSVERAGAARRLQSDGALHPGRRRLVGVRRADARTRRRLSPHSRRRPHRLRAFCDRARPVARRAQGSFRSRGGADRRQADDDAASWSSASPAAWRSTRSTPWPPWCAAGVPTAKTVYILAGEYHCEEPLVAATVSMSTLGKLATLIAWMYALAEVAPLGRSGGPSATLRRRLPRGDTAVNDRIDFQARFQGAMMTV